MKNAFLRDPLFHFSIAGFLLFVGYSYLDPGSLRLGEAQPIRIGAGEVRWLQDSFAAQQGRAPTRDELNGLIETLIAEEAMAREARTMGLDEGDTVVRRRLAQKLEFMIADTASIAAPTERELRQFYSENVDRFMTAPRISFRQVFFDPARRAQPERDARAALTGVSSGVDFSDLGDTLLLDDPFQELDPPSLSNLFGEEFATAVFALEPGAWRGPIKSGYGLHLVKVTAFEPAQAIPFEQVRVRVEEEWRRAKQLEQGAAYMAELRRKYPVEYADSVRDMIGPNVAGEP